MTTKHSIEVYMMQQILVYKIAHENRTDNFFGNGYSNIF